MKAFNLVVKILFALFFATCLAVHIQGIIYHPYPESNLSHTIHLISYTLCFVAVLRKINYRFWVYLGGSLYPFFYHARCLWMHYNMEGKISPVCLLVVIMMPLAALWIGALRD